jgi:CRISPR/Cas system-associated endonuclease Cas3-HD
MSNAMCISFSKECRKPEPYEAHIKASLIAWSLLKPFYYGAINRILGKLPFDPVAIALTLHDLGKLTKSYETNKREYRHELFSAYASYKMLENMVKNGVPIPNDAIQLISLTVMLHHEPIIMGMYVGRYGEEYLTISNLRRVIELNVGNLSPNCDVENAMNNLINYLVTEGFMSKDLGNSFRIAVNDFIKKWRSSLNSEEIFETLKRVVAYSTVGAPNKLLTIRSKAAALLHLVVVSDSIAANIVRSELECSDERDGGTWIVRRIRSGAEPVSYEKIKEEIERRVLLNIG